MSCVVRRKTIILAAFLAGVAVCGGLFHWIWEGAQVEQCHANLSQVAWVTRLAEPLGQLRLPPAYLCDARGVRLHSRRMLIAEMVDIDPAVRYTFSEPWNGPSNMNYAKNKPFGRLYACPRDRQATRSSCTSYVAAVGENTLLREHHAEMPTHVDQRSKRRRQKKVDKRAGCLLSPIRATACGCAY